MRVGAGISIVGQTYAWLYSSEDGYLRRHIVGRRCLLRGCEHGAMAVVVAGSGGVILAERADAVVCPSLLVGESRRKALGVRQLVRCSDDDDVGCAPSALAHLVAAVDMIVETFLLPREVERALVGGEAGGSLLTDGHPSPIATLDTVREFVGVDIASVLACSGCSPGDEDLVVGRFDEPYILRRQRFVDTDKGRSCSADAQASLVGSDDGVADDAILFRNIFERQRSAHGRIVECMYQNFVVAIDIDLGDSRERAVGTVLRGSREADGGLLLALWCCDDAEVGHLGRSIVHGIELDRKVVDGELAALRGLRCGDMESKGIVAIG